MFKLASLPWWVKWAFGGGVGFVTTFASDILPDELKAIGFYFGVFLIVAAGGGVAWHFARHWWDVWRSRKGISPGSAGPPPAKQSMAEPPPIEIVYANECNEVHIQSRFKRSTSLFPNGQPVKHRITLHEFYIGVRNRSARTLKNVQMTIEEVNLPPEVVCIPCTSEMTKTARVDISPARLEYFLLGRAEVSGDAGFFPPTILPADAIEAIAAKISSHSYVGMLIIGADGQNVPLLKNDGYALEFAVYADDTPPAHGRITINARGTLEVLVHGAETQ